MASNLWDAHCLFNRPQSKSNAAASSRPSPTMKA
jgi:hypothetical protein